tara:strand:- start:1263 stop:1706 length:444 start_codon:yes stop_codon:yes gene_type:complete
MQNIIFKNIIFNFFIFFILIYSLIFFDIKYSLALDSLIDQNSLSGCANQNNCVLETWKVENADMSFIELIEILENTPRVKIIAIQKDYLHALATSRIMKYVDDIEVKKNEKDNTLNVKSESRKGFYDLGVNKRRINTLHFRLLDIYS